MLDLTILAIGKVKQEPIRKMCEEYLKRLRPFAKIKIVELAAEPFTVKSDLARARKMEARKIAEYLNKQDFSKIFFLTERGQEFDSVSLAERLDKIFGSMVLVIAGTSGFDESVLASFPKALKLSLSKLTFPHELARLVLLEQVYRAVTIINGKDYHY